MVAFMTDLTLQIPPSVQLTDEQFYEICRANRDLRFERTARGELIIMPPTGGGTGKRNSDLNTVLNLWNRQTQLGVVFDSSTGFRLPNGAERSPDAAWIPLAKWEALSEAEQERFLPLCPDFVIELRSPSDNLNTLRAKLEEYRDNGCQLGWLLNRQDRQVEIYRPGRDEEILDHPATLSGEEILPGFVLDLTVIW